MLLCQRRKVVQAALKVWNADTAMVIVGVMEIVLILI